MHASPTLPRWSSPLSRGVRGVVSVFVEFNQAELEPASTGDSQVAAGGPARPTLRVVSASGIESAESAASVDAMIVTIGDQIAGTHSLAEEIGRRVATARGRERVFVYGDSKPNKRRSALLGGRRGGSVAVAYMPLEALTRGRQQSDDCAVVLISIERFAKDRLGGLTAGKIALIGDEALDAAYGALVVAELEQRLPQAPTVLARVARAPEPPLEGVLALPPLSEPFLSTRPSRSVGEAADRLLAALGDRQEGDLA